MRRGGGRDIARVEEGEGRRENEAINSSPLSLSPSLFSAVYPLIYKYDRSSEVYNNTRLSPSSSRSSKPSPPLFDHSRLPPPFDAPLLGRP